MKTKLLLIDTDYIIENNKGTVRFFCKDENNRSVLVFDSNFQPYFYVKPKENETKELKDKIGNHDFGGVDTIIKVETIEREFMGKPTKLLKLVLDNPRNISNIRNIVKQWKEVEGEYEYTIPFPYRYLLDKKIEPMSWINVGGNPEKSEYFVDEVIRAESVTPIKHEKEINFKILAFDLEIAEEHEEEKIIMISLMDNRGFKKVLTTYKWKNLPNYVTPLTDEKRMLEFFLDIIKTTNPDFIITFNGDDFDFKKLRERSEKLKVKLTLGRDGESVKLTRRGRTSSARINGRVHIDVYNFVNHILSPSMKTEVLSLDAVAHELLGIGKKDVKWKEIEKSWREKKDLERIAEYALRDSELTLKLAEHLLPQIFSLSKLTGTLPFDTSRYYYSQLVEHFLMRKAVETSVLIPNRPKYEEIEKRKRLPMYRGAIVIEPKKGIHSNIMVFDFRSLYPTVIVTHNISPETLNCDCCKQNKVPELDYHFCTKKKGFIPRQLEQVIANRKKIKKQMKYLNKNSIKWSVLDNKQYALKILANASYGYGAYVGARWYCRECAQTATAFGRKYITEVIKGAKKENFEVLYADTDSCFVKVPNVPKERLILISQKWLKKMNNSLPGIIELEFRGLYLGGIFVARKGETKGAKKRYALVDQDGNLEIRGFETVRRDWCDLAKLIQHEVLRIILKEKDPDKAIELVRNTIIKIQQGKAILEELTIYTQLTMPLSQYKQLGPHVRAAMKMKERERPVGEGMIIEYIIVKGKGSISDRAEPAEDVKDGEYDPEYYVNHQVLPAAMRVLQALDISEKQVLSGKIQSKLGEWFGH